MRGGVESAVVRVRLVVYMVEILHPSVSDCHLITTPKGPRGAPGPAGGDNEVLTSLNLLPSDNMPGRDDERARLCF